MGGVRFEFFLGTIKKYIDKLYKSAYYVVLDLKRLTLPEIPESEKTPLVVLLLEIIEGQSKIIAQLQSEIARLKGNPARPHLKPSTTSQLEKTANKNRSNDLKKN